MAEMHRPWPLAAGIATAAAGVTLIALAVFTDGIVTPGLSAAVFILAALLELATGALIDRRGGPGMAHVFAGGLALVLALTLVAHGVLGAGALGAGPVALGIGVFCVVNALFRAIDIFVDRPQGALGESIDTAFTFVIGAALLGHWRDASPAFVAVATGLELVSGGVALLASVMAHERHPDEPAYESREERLARGQAR